VNAARFRIDKPKHFRSTITTRRLLRSDVDKAEAKALLAKGVSRQGAQGHNMTMKMSFPPPSLNRQQC
jgi:hypothetical protein